MDASAINNQSAHIMSVAIAPVFLISGVAGLMSCMTIRYGRVIDRVRAVIKEVNQGMRDATEDDPIVVELQALYRRAKILRTTIIMSAASIFCVALTIAMLFADLMFNAKIPGAAEGFFLLSLAFLIFSVSLFIQDFMLSLKVLKIEVSARLKKDVLPH